MEMYLRVNVKHNYVHFLKSKYSLSPAFKSPHTRHIHNFAIFCEHTTNTTHAAALPLTVTFRSIFCYLKIKIRSSLNLHSLLKSATDHFRIGHSMLGVNNYDGDDDDNNNDDDDDDNPLPPPPPPLSESVVKKVYRFVSLYQ